MNSIEQLSSKLIDMEESNLSRFATRNRDAYRLEQFSKKDFRSEFARDRDRILYSGAFRRYVGKTQVVYFASQFDEHITNRAIHTMQVSQISRTIAKLLRLNQELVESIALGHDLGHAPFGHDGEKFLDNLCHKYGIGHFQHNVQGLRYVDKIANRNRGLNLTFQVRDGMLFHDGESLLTSLVPERKRTEEQLMEYVGLAAAGNPPNWLPATLEGCVVRLCDTVAYLGQDIEDAIRMGILKPEDIPAGVAKKFGTRNSEIISALVHALVTNSLDRDAVSLGEETTALFIELRHFNYERIYAHPEIRKERERIERAFTLLFDHFLSDIENKREDSVIFSQYLYNRSEKYRETSSPPELVRDYMATMTDRYFRKIFSELFVPQMPV